MLNERIIVESLTESLVEETPNEASDDQPKFTHHQIISAKRVRPDGHSLR